MLKDTKEPTITQFLVKSFSRQPGQLRRRICEGPASATRQHAEDRPPRGRPVYQSIQKTKISNPATDCISPIGEDLILKGLRQVVPGEFYAAATRPPAVPGNPS